jgi:hypothetical protein
MPTQQTTMQRLMVQINKNSDPQQMLQTVAMASALQVYYSRYAS